MDLESVSHVSSTLDFEIDINEEESLWVDK